MCINKLEKGIKMQISPIGLYKSYNYNCRKKPQSSVFTKNNAGNSISFSGTAIEKSRSEVLSEADSLKKEMEGCYVAPKNGIVYWASGAEEMSYDSQTATECITFRPEKTGVSTVKKTVVFKSGKLHEIFILTKGLSCRNSQSYSFKADSGEDDIIKEAFYFDVTNGELKRYMAYSGPDTIGGLYTADYKF